MPTCKMCMQAQDCKRPYALDPCKPINLATKWGPEAQGWDQGNGQKVAAPETGCQSWLAADVEAEAADLENLIADEGSWDGCKVLRLQLSVP